MVRLRQNPVEVSKDHFHLVFESPSSGISRPGQFINIKAGPGSDPLIRRPFSVFDHKNGAIEIVVKVIGRGTRIISGYTGGMEIDLLGPLGKGFTIVKDSRVLLVGGGVGNAPLHFLARSLGENNNHITYMYGIRNSEYLYLRENYRSACNRFIVVTDDGSEGEKGFVTDAARDLLKKERFDIIYTCGPSVMMHRLMEAAAGTDTPVEVSLENYFGCGVGLCSGCSVETVSGNRRACVDGPVMDGRIINWNSITD